MRLAVTKYLSNKCWIRGHTVRVTARGSRAALGEKTEGHAGETSIMNFPPPWGGGGGWWRTEGAGFKTIKPIWYGLLQCLEIFERDIVWLGVAVAGKAVIFIL